MVITIDGLSTNGKSTLAEKISETIGFKYFNTGAVYRCITLEIIQRKLNIDNIEQVISNIKNIEIDFRDNKVYLNGLDVTQKIRTPEITFYATKWGTILEIKEFVRNFQKSFIRRNNTVIEGRDVATRIAPDAEVKFYLYSDFETRVYRLWKKNPETERNEIRRKLKVIDDLDIKGGNFIKPKDAIEIDTTNYSLDEVYQIMMTYIKK